MKDKAPSIRSRLADDQFSDHARWIGIIIANWTVLESELEGIYRAVLGLEYHRSKIAFYSVQSFRSQRDAITAAINEFYPKTQLARDWLSIDKPLTNASNARNSVAHAIWAENPKTKVLQLRQTNVRAVYSTPRKNYSVNNLKQQANEIAKVAARLNKIQLLILGMTGKLPQ